MKGLNFNSNGFNEKFFVVIEGTIRNFFFFCLDEIMHMHFFKEIIFIIYIIIF